MRGRSFMSTFMTRDWPVWKIALIFLLVAMVIHVPFLAMNDIHTHDNNFHRVNAILLSKHWSVLVPYPRWLPEAQNGHGSPVFLFYSPLVYFAYAVLDRLTFGLIPFVPLMGLVVALFTGLLGVTTYLWCRDFLSRPWAMGAALVFVLAPDRLDMNMAVRGSFPEVSAMAWLPLIFLAARRLSDGATGKPLWPSVLMAALAYAGLIYTHALTSFMIVPFVAAYAVCRIWFSFGMSLTAARRLAITGGAFAAGLALAAPLLLPALSLLGEITPDYWWHHPYMKPEMWIPFAITTWRGMSPFLVSMSGLAAMFVVLMAQFALMPFFSRRWCSRECLLWIGLGIMAASLTFGFPRFLWADWSPIAKVQFPYRYLSLMEFISLSLAMCVLKDLGARRKIWTRLIAVEGAAIAAGTLVGFVILLVWDMSYGVEPWTQLKRDTYWQPAEYLPAGLTGDFEFTGRVAERIKRVKTPFLTLDDPGGTARLIGQRGSSFRIAVETPAQTALHVRQFWFPGWRALDETTGTDLAIAVDGEIRTLAFTVPAGRSLIHLYREPLPPERRAWILFLIAAGVLAAGSVRHFGWPRHVLRRRTRIRPIWTHPQAIATDRER